MTDWLLGLTLTLTLTFSSTIHLFFLPYVQEGLPILYIKNICTCRKRKPFTQAVPKCEDKNLVEIKIKVKSEKNIFIFFFSIDLMLFLIHYIVSLCFKFISITNNIHIICIIVKYCPYTLWFFCDDYFLFFFCCTCKTCISIFIEIQIIDKYNSHLFFQLCQAQRIQLFKTKVVIYPIEWKMHTVLLIRIRFKIIVKLLRLFFPL